MKLELKHLTPYLPYELKVQGSEQIQEEGKEPWDLTTIHKIKTMTGIISEMAVFDNSLCGNLIQDVKPILRPLSDLTKEITINGETFIPLVYLYKISRCSTHSIHNFLKYEYVKSWGENIILRTYCTDDYYNEFIFDKCNFYSRYVNLKTKIGGECVIENQLILFQKLFEWHFDVFDIIKHDLAIDMNSIK